MRARLTLAVPFAAAALALGACGAPAAPASTPKAAGAAEAAPVKAAPAAQCTQSVAPGGSVQALLKSADVRRIKGRGRLLVGTSGDVLLWGARNPQNGRLEGFDIQLAQEIAKAIGVPIEYRVISTAQRIPSLQNGSVDVVLRRMTINCERWKQINFSAVYYDAG